MQPRRMRVPTAGFPAQIIDTARFCRKDPNIRARGPCSISPVPPCTGLLAPQIPGDEIGGSRLTMMCRGVAANDAEAGLRTIGRRPRSRSLLSPRRQRSGSLASGTSCRSLPGRGRPHALKTPYRPAGPHLNRFRTVALAGARRSREARVRAARCADPRQPDVTRL